ncbi:MAG: L,D-transpeptidase [Desulfobulbaceae bacterium]|nr:L,D-transpeptidase [Desulfobulbaceae bacterium]
MRSPRLAAAVSFFLFVALLCPGPAHSVGPIPMDKALADAVASFVADAVSVMATKEPLRLILVVKDRQRLFVVEHDGRRPRVHVQYICATGENRGNKKVRGDEKTPEGVYFITQVYADSKVTVFGRRAFHLDYPNYFDQEAKRGGDGIFIHGTNRELRSNSTNGCVTLDNRDLDELARYLARDEVPVIIVPQLTRAKKRVEDYDANQIGPVKAFLLPDGVDREQMDFDTLYMVRASGQTVAVSEFSGIGKDGDKGMRGYSRSYLQYAPTSGWVTAQWVWHPATKQVQTATAVNAAPRRFILF